MAPSPSVVLAIDASTPVASLALFDDGRVLAELTIEQKQQSRLLAGAVAGLCRQGNRELGDISRVLFVHGPGSFTGLRIAAATINGMNTAMTCPVDHVSSLAVASLMSGLDSPCRVLEDAKAGEVFSGLYQGAVPLEDDRCVQWDDVSCMPVAAYTGSCAWPQFVPDAMYHPPVKRRVDALLTLSLLAHDSQRYAMPHYVQRSQAERNHRASTL